MFILYGTKEGEIEPVALFDLDARLTTYVNSLISISSGEIDSILKSQSVLADYTDWQTITIDQIWDTWPNWKDQLEKLKLCPRNPVIN